MYAAYKTKIKKLLPLHRLMAIVALFLLVALSVRSPLGAQTAFTQGYGADVILQRGMIVRIDKDDSTKVSAMNYDEMPNMHGIVVDANDAPVTLSSEGQKVFVATGGKYEVLVSDQNEEIKAGDYVTVSSISGIGMKALVAESHVVGRALADFNGREGVVSTAEVTDSAGNRRKVNIGRVMTDITVSRNPNYGPPDSGLPEALRRAAESIVGKQVNTARVYMALIVFSLSTLIAGTLMYGGVRSGIISIGRNPLSKKSIIRGMLQVVISGLIIFILGLFGVYLLLKL